MAEIIIHGLEEFEDRLNQLALSVQRQVLTKAAKEGAKIVAERAKQLQRHTRLAAELKIVPERDSTATSVGVEVGYGRKAFQAYFLEFGTAGHFDAAGAREFGKPGRGVGRPYTIATTKKRVLADAPGGSVFGKQVRHPGITARPSFRPAFEQTREAARDRMGEVLKQEIDKVTNK